MNVNDITDPKNKDSVQRIRQRFVAEADDKPQLYHRIDVSRVRSEDWQIERFILDTHTEDEAFKMLAKAMQWKHSFGIHERTDHYFPKEFFDIFGSEQLSTDREGRLAYWAVHRTFKKIAELTPLMLQFLAHQIEKIDRKAGNRGWLSVNDCLGVGMANVDMTLAKFRVELLNYYPKGMKYGLNVDLPWIIGPIFKVIKGFMNKNIRDHVIIVKREQLTDFFDVEEIPVSFGGKRQCESVTALLTGLCPLWRIKHLDLNQKLIDHFYKTYDIERDD